MIISTRSAAATAALTASMAFAGAAIANDHKGNPNGEPPGQTKPQGEPANPAAPPAHANNEAAGTHGKSQTAGDNGKAKGKGKGKGKGKSRSSKPAGKGHSKGKAKGHGKPAGAANPHAKAGKTTICHATGSATNPYVTITISDNALAAHRRHQDGRDIIPAPAGGCPKPAAGTPAAPGKSHGKGHGKVTICHATGSATNPYVTITIAEPAVDAHRAHQNGEDIIPAPAAGCPGAAPGSVTAGPPAPTPTRAGGPTTAAELPAAAPAAAPAGDALPATPAKQGVLGVSMTSPGKGATNNGTNPVGGVLDESASGSDARPLSTGSLPFTGLDLVLVLLAGLAALIGGLALRRSLRGQHGVTR